MSLPFAFIHAAETVTYFSHPAPFRIFSDAKDANLKKNKAKTLQSERTPITG